MEKILTDDGSFTLRSKKYDQPYHTKSGAIEESFHKYVAVCEVKDGFCILDYCFGLGYNTLAALVRYERLMVVALENDVEILLGMKLVNFSDSRMQAVYSELRDKISLKLSVSSDFTVTVGTSTVRVIVGDALETIKKCDVLFDAIFFDPFSPKVCPELWTSKVFSDMYACLKDDGVLATYSYARAVRDGFKKVGFVVSDGPTLGRRSPSTIAKKIK